MEAILYFFTKPDPNRPIENKFVTEIDGERKSFMDENDAMIFLFDNGVSTFRKLTKEIDEYKDVSKIPTFKFMQIENRIGHITYGIERFVGEDDSIKIRKAYIWRFIGFGRSCFAKTEDELLVKVSTLTQIYNEDKEERGYRTYPYYTRYYR